jgi:uncharacterized membrane protein (UPF0182 family)
MAGGTVHRPLSAGVSEVMGRRLPLIAAGAAVILAGLLAAGETINWDGLLRFVYQVPYGQRDPVFGKDIGFYLFSLPAYIALKNWMLLTVSLSILVAGAVYWTRGHIEFDGQSLTISPAAVAHGSALLGAFFAVKAWSYGLTAISCCTATMASWWVQATRTRTLRARHARRPVVRQQDPAFTPPAYETS